MAFLAPSDINLQDAFLEAMSLIAYIFLFIMIFYARKKNKIFASKGFAVLILAVVLGVISAFMDFFTELYWFDEIEQYTIFKSIMSSLQIASLIIFALSLVLVFRFTKFMMGED
ncbi:MAG: hypothetical protein ACTSRI_18630 [Promethearchaeota archaeon]